MPVVIWIIKFLISLFVIRTFANLGGRTKNWYSNRKSLKTA